VYPPLSLNIAGNKWRNDSNSIQIGCPLPPESSFKCLPYDFQNISSVFRGSNKPHIALFSCCACTPSSVSPAKWESYATPQLLTSHKSPLPPSHIFLSNKALCIIIRIVQKASCAATIKCWWYYTPTSIGV
jgi:hypothetical protein